MRTRTTASIAGFGLFALCVPLLPLAQERVRAVESVAYIYATVNGTALKAHVFRPKQAQRRKPLSALIIFHGGGWTRGEPEWAFGRAEHFAALGLVAVAAQYRLSNQSMITPLEAMADARAVIRWMRLNAAMLGIDANHLAAYGWSAGGHLAASAAIFADSTTSVTVSAAPNALILVSPALDLEKDNWPQRLLGSRKRSNGFARSACAQRIATHAHSARKCRYGDAACRCTALL